MAVISVLGRLIDGVVRNVSLSSNTLQVDTLQALTKVRLGSDISYTDVNKAGYDAVASNASAGATHAAIVTGNPHNTAKSDIGLSNVTNDAQVKGLASGTTSGHLVAFGADGYTVADSGHASSDFEPANSNIQAHIASTSNPHSTTKAQVGLSNVTNDAQVPLAGGTMTGALVLSGDPVAALQAATRQFVLAQIAAAGTSAEWQKSADDKLTAPPVSPATGSRYLVLSPATGAFAGQEDRIAEYNGSSWAFTMPTNGTFMSVDTVADGIYYYGGAWVKKQWERNTAGSAIAIDSNGVVSVSGLADSNVAAGAAIAESKLALSYSTSSLNTAIGGKEPTITAGTSSQYYRGDKTMQTLDTAAVAENASYKYFTDGRAQTAAVVNSTAGSETTQAASVSAMKSYVAAQVGQAAAVFVPFTNTSGAILNVGDVVALSTSVANAIIAAKADAEATCTCIAGVVSATIAIGGTGEVQISGVAVVNNNSVSLNLGKRAYVSDLAAKAATSTAPSTLNTVVYLLGQAVDVDKVLLGMQLVGVNDAV